MPYRVNRFLSVAFVLAAAALAACETSEQALAPVEMKDGAPVVSEQAAPPAKEATVPVEQPKPQAPRKPGISGASYIGQPAASLEALVGQPAFTRKEMAGEFRRYDLGPCRVYAVISESDSGRPVIGSLSISGTMPGAASMTLQQCLDAA
ncbi:hypothetical protein [Aquisalinus flavus]|uniref:Uncharacterized protein n=1 Tax=Aquisalinus flavus TaxID=1526572 RepID=A0A8J2Y7H1_9PROT|nr:hypothetical protein [Aquisalinus flavus]MBD0425621.1 hypothetical protein [Aquisalinus flavus]UNE48761.1 hypothetical protein FF099_12220 [Aquisalinus flavus]GGD14562.1 hypothetical protein GCM10011342_24210 [Aquisalinus flavus]